MKLNLLFLFLFVFQLSFAQKQNERFESIDVQNYSFEIHLNDTTNQIEGKANIRIKFLKPLRNIQLDLVGKNPSTSTGMTVTKVLFAGKPMEFSHENDLLTIDLSRTLRVNETIEIGVVYSGIPADGLIISENKFGDRTFFGDNWPNRARYWLPTVDHPSDKATLDFLIFAPDKYKVVANGSLQQEMELGKGENFTYWREKVPISTKLMVIGVARFSVNEMGLSNNIPVSCWVYPQNEKEGFRDFEIGKRPLSYFSEIIGPYSYEKLAHVQSKTRYGGMENASCIFYAEKYITGNEKIEDLIAHETAHQWFGNSVTEQNWYHVWLSEGFATYLTHLYDEHFYGEKAINEGMIADRERVIKFAEKRFTPVIDTVETDYNKLLNANSYQKASWFLHMLRNKIGADNFFKTLQEYYNTYQNSTALTKDFEKVAENVSGQDLKSFFDEWLRQAGFPVLKWNWKQKSDGSIQIKIKQHQKNFVFQFPLDLKLISANGESEVKTISISESQMKTSFSFDKKVKNIELDPNVKLLFEEK